MTSTMKPLISQFHLQTRLFKNVTDSIIDAEAQTRLNGNTNHIAWLTGHIVSTRFVMANVLGVPVKEPFPELFENGKGMDPEVEYPSMNDLLKDWEGISGKILPVLEGLTDEALEQKGPFPVPTGDTVGDFVTFLMHHEAYTIGQIGIARRFFGREAMKYS